MENSRLTFTELEKELDLPWPPAGREKLPRRYDYPASYRHAPVPDAVVREGEYWATIPAPIAGVAAPQLGAATAWLEHVTNEIVRFDATTGASQRPWSGALLQLEAASSARLALVISEPQQYWDAKVRNKGSEGGRAVRAIAVATERAREFATEAGPLGQAEILELHGLALRAVKREWREQQYWVDDPIWPDARTAFFPTPPERIAAAMDDLAAFARRLDLPALLHSALLHAQCLTISPFAVGNGRVARLATQAHLRARGLTAGAVLPLSAALLRVRADLPPALARYRAGDAAAATYLFVDAAARAVEHARRLQATLDGLAAELEARLQHAEQRSASRRLLHLVLEQPVFQARGMAQRLGASRPAFYAAAHVLEAAGIIEPLDAAVRRGRVWVAREVVEKLRP